MPNKWTERYNVYKLDVDRYIQVIVAWNPESRHEEDYQGYFQSVNFNSIKFTIPTDSISEGKKKVLMEIKKIAEKMLVDINLAIEEEGKEE